MNKDYLNKLEGWARQIKARVQEDKRLLLVPGAFVACALIGGIAISAIGSEEEVETVSLVSAQESVVSAQQRAEKLAAAREADELARLRAEKARKAAEAALQLANRQAESEQARLDSMNARLAHEASARAQAEQETRRLENRLVWLEHALESAPAQEVVKERTVVVENNGPSWWEYDAVVARLEAQREWNSLFAQQKEEEFARRKASLLDALKSENEELDTLPVQLQPWSRPGIYSINFRPEGE